MQLVFFICLWCCVSNSIHYFMYLADSVYFYSHETLSACLFFLNANSALNMALAHWSSENEIRVIFEMSLLNVKTEIPLSSGFEISACKMQNDPRSSAGPAGEYKVWVLLCWSGLALYLSFSAVFLLCTLFAVYLCPVFAQCLAQTSPVCN